MYRVLIRRARHFGLIVLLPSALVGQQQAVAVGPVTWQPIVENGGHFFPSFAIATATMTRTIDGRTRFRDGSEPAPASPAAPLYRGDAYGLFGVRIRSSKVPMHIRVTVEAWSLAQPSSIDVDLLDSTRTYEVFPQILYNDRILQSFAQPTTATVTFRLNTNDTVLSEQKDLVRVRSVNDVPFAVDFRLGGHVDQAWMFSAFVNENSPVIDQILSQALQARTVTAFTGYQLGAQSVYQQIFAVWDVFQRHGIKYSSIATPSAEGEGVYAQTVRDLSESLRSSQANCVDGTVLFASVLRKIGIDPVLIVRPGHMYLGYYLDAKHSSFATLETTEMGNVQLARLPEDGTLSASLARAFGGQSRNSASANSFLHAFNTSLRNYAIDVDSLRRRVRGYALIDVGMMRKLGVAPIGK
jgi:hypothetical protein